MTMKRQRLQSRFTLGGQQAEADSLFDDAFVQSSDFRVIASEDDKRCFIVGRTGSGKSAALNRIEEIYREHVVRISPEDLSLPYITNLQAIRYLDSLEINLDIFWSALWKHVLLVEIIRHRYNVDSPAAKQNFLSNLREKIRHDRAKRAALEYLDEYEGRFWCEADERVREITDTLTNRLDAEAGLEASLGPAGANILLKKGSEKSSTTRAEQIDRFQKIINETQLARLNKMMNVLDEDILDSRQHYTYVVIDDLDRDWVDERIANDLIRCLFQTVLHLKRVRNLKVLVALRTNIFQELDFGKRGGGQEEKFRSLVLRMRWSKTDLAHLLDERVRVGGAKIGLEATSLAELLPVRNKTRGDPVDYLLERTLMRPRDAIAFANECFSVGVDKSRLSWDDIKTAERSYSTERLLALRDEWKPTYPGINNVLEKFQRSPLLMTKSHLQDRLEEVMLLLSDPSFEGARWLTEKTASMWHGSRSSSWFELYQPLLKVLYDIGFIGCAQIPSRSPVFHLDDPLFVDRESNLERCDAFYVHRTFHLALDMHSASKIRSMDSHT